MALDLESAPRLTYYQDDARIMPNVEPGVQKVTFRLAPQGLVQWGPGMALQSWLEVDPSSGQL